MPRFTEVLKESLYDIEISGFTFKSPAYEEAGSSLSRSFWEDKDGELWFAKSDSANNAEEQAFLESCANKIYAYYGVPVARLAIAKLPCEYRSKDVEEIYKKQLKRKKATHVLSRWIDRFNCYPYCPSFTKGQEHFLLKVKNQELKEKGLGHILAVAHFINDVDVIGGSGKNVGYRFSFDGSELKLISSKIDPGYAFKDFKEQDVIKITTYIQLAPGKVESFDDLPEQTKIEFIITLQDIITTPDEDLSDFFLNLPNCTSDLKTTIDKIIKSLKCRKINLLQTFGREIDKLSTTHLEHKITSNIKDIILQQIYVHNVFANQDFLYKQAKEFYIELSTSKQLYSLQLPSETIPLTKIFEDFLNDNKLKILSLLGDGGTGKSIATQRWREALWQKINQSIETTNEDELLKKAIALSLEKPDLRNIDWVPIYIELKNFDKDNVSNCVNNTLIDEYKLSFAQIKELKQNYKCLFIFDGFDEIDRGLKINLWKKNKLGEWYNAKILITSRISHIRSSDFFEFLSIPNMLDSSTVVYLTPFNQEQIIYYLKNTIKEDELYLKNMFQKQPNLIDLLGVPLILKIFQETWPSLKTQKQDNLKRFTLYKIFIKQWFNNNEKRLVVILKLVEQMQEKFNIFSKKLAFDMYNQNKLEMDEKDVSDLRAFFDSNDVGANKAQQACPLRKVNESYSFIHRSFLEYFVADVLWEHKDSEESFFEKWSTRNVTQEPEIINFLVDCFELLDLDSKNFWQQKFINYIKKSKIGSGYNNAAAGAMSFLNKLQFPFSNEDLSGLDISGADLSYGVFDSTNFRGTKLVHVNFTGAWLCNATLEGSNMEGILLGELTCKQHDAIVLSCCYSSDRKYFAAVGEKCIKIYSVDSVGNLTEIESVTTDEDITSCSFSFDNKYFAVATGNNIMLFSRSITFSQDNQWLASGSDDNDDNTLRLWSSNKSTLIGHTSEINSITFSQDNQWLASGGDDNTVRLWSLTKPNNNQALIGHTNEVHSITFSQDSQWLVSGSDDKTVRLWNVSNHKDPKKNKILILEEGPVFNVTFSFDNQWLASSYDNKVRLWNVSDHKDPKENKTLTGHTANVISLTFSQDSQWLASAGGIDQTVCLWNLIDPNKNRTLTGHTSLVYSIAFSQNSQWLASGSGDKTVRLWSLNDPKENKTLTGHTNTVLSVTFSQDNQFLASGSGDKTVRLWRLKDHDKSQTLAGHTEFVFSVTFSQDNQWLASGSLDKTVCLWSLIDPNKNRTLTGHAESVLSVAFSQDNEWLASGGVDKTLRLWNILDSNKNKILTGHTDSIRSVIFSCDNQWLVSGSDDKTVRLWNVSDPKDPKKNKILILEEGPVFSIIFSFDNQWLASSYDNRVCLWEVYCPNSHSSKTDTLSISCYLDLIHTTKVYVVAFSPDKKWLASGSKGYTCLWNLTYPNKNQTLTEHNESVLSVTFSQDNEWLASGSFTKIIFWNKESSENIHAWSKKFIVKTNFNLYSITYKLSSNSLLLATGGSDCSVQLFKQLPNDKLVLLRNSSHRALNPTQTDITAARLSVSNAELLLQRGATGNPTIIENERLVDASCLISNQPIARLSEFCSTSILSERRKDTLQFLPLYNKTAYNALPKNFRSFLSDNTQGERHLLEYPHPSTEDFWNKTLNDDRKQILEYKFRYSGA
jgi:WD40 repeat protein